MGDAGISNTASWPQMRQGTLSITAYKAIAHDHLEAACSRQYVFVLFFTALLSLVTRYVKIDDALPSSLSVMQSKSNPLTVVIFSIFFGSKGAQPA